MARSQTAAATLAVQLLATIGPLPPAELLDAVHRSRRFTQHDRLTVDQLMTALQRAGAVVDDHGRWHAPMGTTPTQRYRAIAATLAGRDLSRRDLVEALISVGYTPASADGRILTTHPLVRQVGPNHYRLLAATTDRRP